MRTGPEPFPSVIVTRDGDIAGWTRAIPGAVWQPGADVLWQPAGTKALDIAGKVAEVEPTMAPEQWVRLQLDKRSRYLDIIREKVRAGVIALTPVLAKMLGLPYEPEEEARIVAAGRPIIGAVALGGKTLSLLPPQQVRETRLPVIEEYPDLLLTERRKSWVS